MNLYCADSDSKRISTAQTLAPNESLLRRLRLQTNLYCADSSSKQISTAQTLAPNESLLRRLWLQMNLYCADSGSKQITTAQTLAPNKSLLRRLWLQTNLYCVDLGSIKTLILSLCFAIYFSSNCRMVFYLFLSRYRPIIYFIAFLFYMWFIL